MEFFTKYPKVKMSKMGEYQELQPIDGLQISAISADLYSDGRDDCTLFFFEEGANFDGMCNMLKSNKSTVQKISAI